MRPQRKWVRSRPQRRRVRHPLLNFVVQERKALTIKLSMMTPLKLKPPCSLLAVEFLKLVLGFFLGGMPPKNMKIFTAKARQGQAIGTCPALRPSRASQGSPFHAAHRPGRCGILAAGSLDSDTSIQHGIMCIYIWDYRG